MRRNHRLAGYLLAFMLLGGLMATGPQAWATPSQTSAARTVPTRTPKPTTIPTSTPTPIPWLSYLPAILLVAPPTPTA